MNKKVVGLLSGGLDSSLAFKIIQELGFEIIALNFKSPFCTCNRKKEGENHTNCKSNALEFAQKEGITLRAIYLGDEYLEMIRNPRHGYGKNINPCVDCRILMFTKAKEVMEEIKAEFIFTGEVLGQRPMSQRRDSFGIIERETNLKGLIVRPLSAGLLPPTIPELNGVIDRTKLLKLSGRSRKPQIAAAASYGMTDYPCAAGGCLLTEVNFSRRVKDLIAHSEKTKIKDAQILRFGRHFRLSPECKVIVGRNENDNNSLEKFFKEEDYFFRVKDYPGPLVMARGNLSEQLIPIVSQIAVRYSDAPKDESVEVCYYQKNITEKEERINAVAISDAFLSPMRI